MGKYISLFSGIGGFELGLGSTKSLLAQSEIDQDALKVLKTHFKSPEMLGDVTTANVNHFTSVEMLVGGFPCQDVSIVGGQKGMEGTKTALVEHIFRLAKQCRPNWIFLENVQSIRFVHGGRALQYVINESEKLGYNWAYRTLDSHAFGLPQRRRRFYFLASRSADPKMVLFSNAGPKKAKQSISLDRPIGFYWTEGKAGHGITDNAIPPLKAGSSIGIPSPPAVLFPDGGVKVPTIETAERLQGFQPGWTSSSSSRRRWTLVGNAVSPPVIEWIATQFDNTAKISLEETDFAETSPYPLAAYGYADGVRRAVSISESPSDRTLGRIEDLSDLTWNPISERALKGFYTRATGSNLRYPDGFLDRLKSALALM